jgi:predicted TPR repeat methyltransferase
MNEWDCYEAGAEVYSAAGEDDPAWRQRHRARFVSMLHGSVVADLGCGPGFDLAAFAALGLQTVGVDGSAAMLKIAARNSPSSMLANQDLRRSLGHRVDGLWSMFALLHIPETDLAKCFGEWRQSVTDDGPLMLALVESEVLQTREVSGWLGQQIPCTFYYHRSACVQEMLSSNGWKIVSAVQDTPECYRGGHYDELKLSAYVITARAG